MLLQCTFMFEGVCYFILAIGHLSPGPKSEKKVHLPVSASRMNLEKVFGLSAQSKVKQNCRGFLHIKTYDFCTKRRAKSFLAFGTGEKAQVMNKPFQTTDAHLALDYKSASVLHHPYSLVKGREYRVASGFLLQKKSRQRTYWVTDMPHDLEIIQVFKKCINYYSSYPLRLIMITVAEDAAVTAVDLPSPNRFKGWMGLFAAWFSGRYPAHGRGLELCDL